MISEEQLNEVAHSVSAAEWYQINIEDTERFGLEYLVLD